MIEVSEITLEKLRRFTDQSNTLITIDAPLFGSVMIFNGRILQKGASYVEPEKIGASIGFPAYEHVVAEAIEAVQLARGFVTDHGLWAEREQPALQLAAPHGRRTRELVGTSRDVLDDAALAQVLHLVTAHSQLFELGYSEHSVLACCSRGQPPVCFLDIHTPVRVITPLIRKAPTRSCQGLGARTRPQTLT